MSMRKIAGLVMAFGLAIGLVGSGVGASFMDTATAVANINVGTFGVQISSSTSGAVIDTVGLGGWNHSVTYACPAVQSSAAGTCPLQFTITNMGSMPATITVAAVTSGDASFTATAVAAGPTVIPVGGHVDFTGGLSWGVLVNSDLGKSASVTYTITATA